jgi:transposase, IS5 family
MRKKIAPQLGLVAEIVNHPHAQEMAQISALLDKLPELAELIASQLSKGTRGGKAGRTGMSGEQVLRAMVLKQIMTLSYTELAFHLADSTTYRAFCRLGAMDDAPKRATLQENIKRVGPAVLEQVSGVLVKRARKLGVEVGKRSRIDSTVIDANIHDPTDSRLLYDVVRVLARIMKQSVEYSSTIQFSNHTKRAKRRAFGIANASSMDKRVPLYRDLLQVTQWTIEYAERNAAILMSLFDLSAQAAGAQLQHYVELGRRVIDQTQRRIFQDESVPASEKLVSIFEPHTDVIVKDRRQTLYGHKVFLNVGESGMVLDMLMQRGNPADAATAITMLERHSALLGRVPEQAAFDAGFTSKANIEEARRRGVKDASFAKKGSIDVLGGVRMASEKTHRKLQHFRAGVEGIISFAKRSFGFGRCLWRSYRSFQAYAWSCVVSINLLILARHTLT